MKKENQLQKYEYFLAPGYMIIPDEPMIIYMVLGSCVSVIIRDKKYQRSGCCHFLVPKTPRGGKPKPKHGNVAVLTLIRMLTESGSHIRDMEAQVIGGGDMPGNTLGRKNVEAALKALEKRGVHISSMDVGGDKGRKVIYNSQSNHLAVVKVEQIRDTDWYPTEVN